MNAPLLCDGVVLRHRTQFSWKALGVKPLLTQAAKLAVSTSARWIEQWSLIYSPRSAVFRPLPAAPLTPSTNVGHFGVSESANKVLFENLLDVDHVVSFKALSH